MESSVKASQSRQNPKPALGSKPLLTPKPFSMKNRTQITSINAPRAVKVRSWSQTEPADESKPTGGPQLDSTAPALAPKSPQPTSKSTSRPRPVSVPIEALLDQIKAGDSVPQKEDSPDSGVPDPTPKPAPVKKTVSAEPVQKDNVQTNHKTSTDAVSNSEQKDENETNKTLVSAPQKAEEPVSEIPFVISGPRKRLSMELTSRFESGGVPLPPQPVKTTTKPNTKCLSVKAVSSEPEQKQAAPEPSNNESNSDDQEETSNKIFSIQNRIDRLFGSVSRRGVTTKKEEPDIIDGIGGVKKQIKNWAAETGSESPKTETTPRVRSTSFEPAAVSPSEKTPEKITVEVPVADEKPTLAVDPQQMVSSAEQPTKEPPKEASTKEKSPGISTDTPAENNQTTEDVVQLRRPRTTDGAADNGPRRNLRRSVRFGIVETDDGSPPKLLGSDPESSSEEEEEDDENEKDDHLSDPRLKLGQKEKRINLEFQRKVKEEEKQSNSLNSEESLSNNIESKTSKTVQKSERKPLETKKREEEMLKEEELEKERQIKQKELEEKRKKEEEEKEKEKLRKEAKERERLEEERRKEKQRLEEEKKEKQRQEEDERKEKQRQEEERKEKIRLEEEKKLREKERQEEIMREKLRQEEEEKRKEKQRLEEERLKEKLRREEEEKRKEKQRREEEEKRKEKQRLEEERLKEKLRQEEEERRKEKQRLEEERLKEKLRQEEEERRKEKQRREEEEKRKEKQKLEEVEKLRQEEIMREKLRQEEEKLKEKQRQEEERLREKQRQEEEKLREKQRQEEEMLKEKQRQEEGRLREKLRQEEERLREKLRQEEEKLREKQRQEEEEESLRAKQRQEEERLKEKQRQEEQEKLKEKQRQEEQERLREKQRQEEEEERLRAKQRQEEERLKEKQRREEQEKLMEKQRQEEQEKLRAKQRQEEERLKEKLRQEEEERRKEKQRREEEEKRKEKLRQEEILTEKLRREEEKLKEKQRQEEKGEEERKRAMEKERAEVQVDLKKLQTQKTARGGERKEPETGEESGSNRKEESLISFDSENRFQKTESSNVDELTESLIDVVYDDFSVRKPSLEVEYDDFSVKPTKWIPQTKAEPVSRSWAADKNHSLMSFNNERRDSQGKRQQVEKEPVKSPTQENSREKETGLLVDFGEEEDEEEESSEEDELVSTELEEEEEMKEDDSEEDYNSDDSDNSKTQTGSYFINHEDKDNDDSSDNESHQQDEIHDGTSETDSPKPVSEELLDEDVVDFCKEPEFVPFPEMSTPLLDTSTQRSKAQLNRARNRTLPSRSFRADVNKRGRLDWTVNTDTTDNLPAEKQSDADKEQEEEPSQPKAIISPPSATSKVPMFPGLSPAALLAGIKKRAGIEAPAAVEETEKNKESEEKESPMEEEPPAQPVRSPRLPGHMAGAARVLPPMGGTGGSAGSSPAWLAELKSKKRMSQQGGKT